MRASAMDVSMPVMVPAPKRACSILSPSLSDSRGGTPAIVGLGDAALAGVKPAGVDADDGVADGVDGREDMLLAFWG